MKRKTGKPEGIAQEAWDAVDSPGLTEESLGKLRSVATSHPELVKACQEGTLKRRGPQRTPTKVLISMRYSQEVLDFFRATGPGWQTKMDEALKQWIQDHPEAPSTSGR
jgi:uncharacterized protein (DUF4415 family)